MSSVNKRYTDHDHDDSISGSANPIGSTIDINGLDEPALGRHSSKSKSRLSERLHTGLLAISFGVTVYLLFLTVTTAFQNNAMLASLQPYAIDLANVTNRTWGYGGMPVEMQAGDKMGGHDHGKNHEMESSKMGPLSDEEYWKLSSKDLWKPPQGNEPFTSFPTTSDTLDELRPDEKVSYDMNFLVKKHVSTVMQYNRRITAKESYRLSHTICVVQAFMPPLRSLMNNKTLITSNSPIDIWLLETPPDGEWWAGKGFEKNGRRPLRTNMTWNSKLARKEKLGTIHAWPGLNTNTGGSFECPKPSGKKGERIAVEYACAPGPTEESCYLSFDASMTYPVLMFEVVF